MTDHGHHRHDEAVHDHDRTTHRHDEAAHRHEHPVLDEASWARWATDTELEGEVLLGFVTETVARLAGLPGWVPPSTIADVGSGPAVAACELARLFPEAHVIAFDSSAAMLERAGARIARLGFEERTSVVLGEIPDDLGSIGEVDLVWASMSLHHVGDEVAALRALGDIVSPTGCIAIAEMADPVRMLPTDLGVGRAGLGARIQRLAAEWFADMRHGLPSAVESGDLAVMVARAGLTVVDDRVVVVRLDAPLSAESRRFVTGLLGRTRSQLATKLLPDDLEAIDVLLDDEQPLSLAHRDDAFIEATRRIVIARVAPPT